MGRYGKWLFIWVCVKSFACDTVMFVGYWIENYTRSTHIKIQIHQEYSIQSLKTRFYYFVIHDLMFHISKKNVMLVFMELIITWNQKYIWYASCNQLSNVLHCSRGFEFFTRYHGKSSYISIQNVLDEFAYILLQPKMVSKLFYISTHVCINKRKIRYGL